MPIRSSTRSLGITAAATRYGDLGEAAASATLFMLAMMVLAVIAHRLVWRPETDG